MLAASIWGGIAAVSLLIGYALATRGLSNRLIGMMMGVGAGALISSIAYELVPESSQGGLGMAVFFALGALIFFAGDWLIDRRGGDSRKNVVADQQRGSGPAIFIGTLLDALPESVILGMSLVAGSAVNLAFLAAVSISNLPEGVAGSINLEAAGFLRGTMLMMWSSLVVISAISAGLGYLAISSLPQLTGLYA